MTPNSERVGLMRSRAAELARSGYFKSWVEVERSLIDEGWVEARIEFASPQSRTDIDEVCRIAQGARARGISYIDARVEERRKKS